MDPSWTSFISSSVTQLFQNPEVIIPYRLEQSSKLAFEPQDSFTNALEVVNYIRYISCRVNRGKEVVANFELLKEVLINEMPFNEPHYAIEMIIFMLEKAKTCVATLNKIYNQRKSIDNGVTLKKKEIYDLLSACFFCCFSQERVSQIKLIDFAGLYEKHSEENPQHIMNSAKKEKIKCLLNYFKYGYKNYNEQCMKNVDL
ncbi:uncharacterized protein LOC135947979 [Cloeon dipterum]|uniref:uncharacterized protein LOC135947979 n=1 Tax=Cloeon dipterum TaxID=197152 RepID=UPI00321FDBE6